ncbi:MAG: glycosyltransferase [Chloroflexota bacterium]|nr:glycosyltransferase [Chloroflexota bacterium]
MSDKVSPSIVGTEILDEAERIVGGGKHKQMRLIPRVKSESSKQVFHQENKMEELWIVHLSTFPPRKCGIATFTEDLLHSMDDLLAPNVKSKVVAINTLEIVHYNYPRKVIFQINQENEDEYVQVAERLNSTKAVKLVNIQHEFGLFGGNYGAHLISFVNNLTKPMTINFHTVIPNPNEEIWSVVRALAKRAKSMTVMTRRSKTILVEDYGIDEDKIWIIPHGIHSRPYGSSTKTKAALGLENKMVISTFGLLSRGKGIEYVIESLPQVTRQLPNLVYLILGATHPSVLIKEGEDYRNSLIQKVYSLGLAEHVKFYNKYLDRNELLKFLKATDIYISSSLDPNQAVSGTLSYALGMGRPVISTAFAQANEDVTAEVGLLVDFKNSSAFTEAITKLLAEEDLRIQLGRNAYFRTRRMTWPNVALQYAKVFSVCGLGLNQPIEQKTFPKMKLDHLIRLTDSFGIAQFANGIKPDHSTGYTMDDNARALIVCGLYYHKLESELTNAFTLAQKEKVLGLINTYLGFIEFAAGEEGYFENYVRIDKSLDYPSNREANLDDATGRALYSLALTCTIDLLPMSVRMRALRLLESKVRDGISLNSPRAIAHHCKALYQLIKSGKKISDIDCMNILKNNCDQLVSLYKDSNSPEWQWFEIYLTYSNAVIPEALLLGYKVLANTAYLEIGKTTMDFLIRKTFVNGVYMPIGQDGWYHKNGRRSHFDQQPEDVTTMVYALHTLYSITRDEEYKRLMYKAFYWFLGDNSLNQVVYDRNTGGCYDGIGQNAINLNQGAEATISYLLARLAF